MTGYPQTANEWATAIEQGLGLTPEEALSVFACGRFPYDRLEAWIRSAYGEGFGPNFVPALLRNKHGLVRWAYGNGSEPYWPGSDKPGEAL
jgi:hypothetical protein